MAGTIDFNVSEKYGEVKPTSYLCFAKIADCFGLQCALMSTSGLYVCTVIIEINTGNEVIV